MLKSLLMNRKEISVEKSSCGGQSGRRKEEKEGGMKTRSQEVLQLLRTRHPDFSVPRLMRSSIMAYARWPFLLSSVHPNSMVPNESWQGSIRSAVTPLCQPPPLWPQRASCRAAHSRRVHTVPRNQPTSPLLFIMVRLHVVSSSAVSAWFSFSQTDLEECEFRLL